MPRLEHGLVIIVLLLPIVRLAITLLLVILNVLILDLHNIVILILISGAYLLQSPSPLTDLDYLIFPKLSLSQLCALSFKSLIICPDTREDNHHHHLYHHCHCPHSVGLPETITQFQNSHIRQCQPGPRPQGSWKFGGKSMNLDTFGIFGCKDLGSSNFLEQFFSKH